MALRSARERVVQTLCYEAGGFFLATPLYALIAGHDAGSSSLMVIAVAIACMVWSPLHNTVFDWLDWRIARRVASDRPHGFRILHAISHEVTSIIITTPIIMVTGGHSFFHALLVDIGLTLLYSVYAYFFHILYDWMRPVAAVSTALPERAVARPVTVMRRASRSDDGASLSQQEWRDRRLYSNLLL